MEGVYISADSVVEEGAKIYAPSFISEGSHICKGAVILPGTYVLNSYVGGGSYVIACTLENSHLCGGCSVGPYAHIRGGSYVGEGCRIGNFVELKAAELGAGTKVAHLSYVGDAILGREVNVGCGVVFCNYDGKTKRKTYVGDRVFIGSNCNLVAPICIGEGAYIAAGATVTEDIPPLSLAVGRAPVRIKAQGAAGRYKNGGGTPT